MADKPQIDSSARGSSSRESSPEEHRVGLIAGQQLSMDSLILSGESSDDILMDELEDDEEIVSGEEEDDDDDDEAMTAADTEAGSLEGVNGAVDQSQSSGVGRSSSGLPNNQKQPATGEQQQQTRNKKKRRVSTRQRKISISSRLKVSKCLYQIKVWDTSPGRSRLD